MPEKPTRKVESTNPFEEPTGKNPFEEEDDDQQPAHVEQPSPAINLVPASVSPFQGLISRCFENHLSIFVDGQDRYTAVPFLLVHYLKSFFFLVTGIWRN